MLIYPTAVADRLMATMQGPVGGGMLLQPALLSNNVMMFWPQNGGIGTGGSFSGPAWTTNGTVVHPNPSSGSLAASQRRTAYENVVTTQNQQLGPRMNSLNDMTFWRGNAAGLGGFFFYARFHVRFWPASTVRLFAGLQGAGASTSVVTSDTVGNNTLGLWHDTTDPASGAGALNIVTRDTATTTKTSISLANAIAANNMYDVYKYHPPNGSAVSWRLDDLTNAVTYNGSVSATLPLNTAFMSPQVQMSNGTANITVATTSIAITKIYVEAIS